jgi:hypothetical protein
VAILNPLLIFLNDLILEVIVVIVGVLEEHGSGSLFQIPTNPFPSASVAQDWLTSSSASLSL